MNRRDALKLLTALPAVKSVEVAHVAPNDVIVIESDIVLSHQQAENLRMYASRAWPDRKIVVLEKGLRVRIAREA